MWLGLLYATQKHKQKLNETAKFIEREHSWLPFLWTKRSAETHISKGLNDPLLSGPVCGAPDPETFVVSLWGEVAANWIPRHPLH